MARGMKQLKAAKRAVKTAEDADRRRVLIAKWAKGSRCPYCRNLFDNKASLTHHLNFSCRGDPDARAVKKRVDPAYPMLGRVPKHSLLGKLMFGDDTK